MSLNVCVKKLCAFRYAAAVVVDGMYVYALKYNFFRVFGVFEQCQISGYRIPV